MAKANEEEESTESLSVYLGKAGITTPGDLLKTPAALKEFAIKDGNGDLGTLYVQTRKAKVPRWAKLFEGQVDPGLVGRTSSTAAVFLVPIKSRLFALAFGQGRYLIKAEATEDQFGRIVTLNSVGEDRVRSLDKQTFDTLSRHTRVQASREARPTDLGIDVDLELVRTFTGSPEDGTLGRTLSGVDSLKVLAKVGVEGLRELLGTYLEEFGKDTYKKRFPWIDQISPVFDHGLIEQLDAVLLSAIEAQNFEHLWLAVPEPIDWSQVDGFRYGKRPILRHDISVSTFLDSLPHGTAVDAPLLKRREVQCVGADDAVLYVWSVYKCINFETVKSGTTFLLNSGKWYAVEKNLVKQVNDEVALIPAFAGSLPEYADETEGEYNARVAKTDPPRFALMDAKLIPWGGGASKFEFCDLYTDKREMIHIKRYGGSAVLSHLFNQGTHSAELFITEEAFRAEVNKLLKPSHKFDPKPRPDPSKHTVVFAIVSIQKGSALTLPFFSRLSLRHAVRRLRGFGFKCALAKIAVDDTIAKLQKVKAKKQPKKK